MVELKQRILYYLSNLSDRDTYQIAIEELETLIRSIHDDPVPKLLKCLFHASSTDPKPTILYYVFKLKVRDACRDAIGLLSTVYVKGEGKNCVIALFVRPLFDAIGENSKGAPVCGAMCLGRVVGAIAPQGLEPLLQSIYECLASADWDTHKANADTLAALALHSSDLIKDGATSTLTILETCPRFPIHIYIWNLSASNNLFMIKPVRDRMTEALELWKKIGGKAMEPLMNKKRHLMARVIA
ncbi:hypothetical protein Nepgr_007567 [Nepenthes gracilis]|uniref:TORTIFOLIA1/SINE1-2 N-terminal domain-containing protein n=1 Tax=Nepenthes gracilis TaxID=150966 RepID=A0AAD3XID3_NEPGR|nr:hypothetical protein Nepgr_007567 [Nepenthes gracilis]